MSSLWNISVLVVATNGTDKKVKKEKIDLCYVFENKLFCEAMFLPEESLSSRLAGFLVHARLTWEIPVKVTIVANLPKSSKVTRL